MRPVLKAIYEAALHPHLTAEDFRICFVKAVEYRDIAAHESIEDAFKRYAQEAIFAYERDHFAK